MEYIDFLAMFIAYPFFMSDTSLIFVTNDDIDFDFHKQYEVLSKKLEESKIRLNKLCDLLSSEFTSKAPENIVIENCKKLEETEDIFNNFYRTKSYLDEAILYWENAKTEEIENIKSNFNDYKCFQIKNYIFCKNK
jgi:hypothetical protein